MPQTPNSRPATSALAVVDVRFRKAGRVYRYDAGSLPLRRGDRVVVQGNRGLDLGTVADGPRKVQARRLGKKALPRIVKKATPRDLAREETNLRRGRDAEELCMRRIQERRMKMKVVKAESLFDGSKIIIYFFAAARVDFRGLVRNLAQSLHTRIELKQIGPRDETKLVGGLGPCGRELCCSSWLSDFDGVSVKMAKEQGLSLNPAKLAGMCGRLKCCLRYEYDTYRDLARPLPAVGTSVEAVKASGVVVRRNPLKQTVLIRDAAGHETEAALEDLLRKKPA